MVSAEQIIAAAFGDRDDAFAFANLVLRTEAPKYGAVGRLPIIQRSTAVVVETWTAEQVRGVVAEAAKRSALLADDGQPPRRFGGRIVYADLGIDALVLLDGRHRSWQAQSDGHEVAILQLRCAP